MLCASVELRRGAAPRQYSHQKRWTILQGPEWNHPELAGHLVFMTGGGQLCAVEDHAIRPPKLNKPFDFETLKTLLRRFMAA